MIPKKVHYCWFGKETYPDLIQKCIQSWKEFLPDYELILWNEENTALDNPWLQRAFSQKKYAFVADYIRFRALFTQGGIYLDTDMLLVRSLNPFLTHDFFMGFEDLTHVNMAIIGAEKRHPLLEIILREYQNLFDTTDFKVITLVVTPIIKNYMGNLDPHQIQEKNGVVLFPADYFYPVPYTSQEKWEEYPSYFTENTFAAHLWYKSWYDEFTYFSIQEYQKGFTLLFEKLKKDPFQPLSYFWYLGYSLFTNFKKSLFGKKKSSQ